MPKFESFYNPEEVDRITRLEVRQLVALCLCLELMSIFSPHVIGPSI